MMLFPRYSPAEFFQEKMSYSLKIKLMFNIYFYGKKLYTGFQKHQVLVYLKTLIFEMYILNIKLHL